MVEGISKTDDEIISVLKYYVPNRWHDLNNWSIILERCKQISSSLFLFKCSYLELFFDKNMVIQEFGNVLIINNKVYYELGNTKGFEKYFGEMYLNDLYDSSKTSIIDREDLKSILRRYNAKNGV